VKRLPLSIRYGRRHTRGREPELENISCSPLHIRRPRVHVPPRIFPACAEITKKAERSTHTAVAAAVVLDLMKWLGSRATN